MEDNLDERPREILDEDDLRERGLKNRFQVPLTGSYIVVSSMSKLRPRGSSRKSAGILTSNPCGWSYDHIDVCLISVLVPPLGLDGSVG